MRSRTECEAEITAAYEAFRQAEDAGDQLGADAQELRMNALVEEYGHLPLQCRPHD